MASVPSTLDRAPYGLTPSGLGFMFWTNRAYQPDPMEAKQMRTAGFTALAFSLFALAANAQTKIAGKIACPKPDTSYSLEAGDRTGHILMLQKTTCKWTTPMEIEGLRTQEGTDVNTADSKGTTITEQGYHTSTMDNGNKFTVRYQGTIKASKDGSATIDGKWVFTNGTGKLKGIKGGGTYKGAGSSDGSGNIDIEGEYKLGTTGPGK